MGSIVLWATQKNDPPFKRAPEKRAPHKVGRENHKDKGLKHVCYKSLGQNHFLTSLKSATKNVKQFSQVNKSKKSKPFAGLQEPLPPIAVAPAPIELYVGPGFSGRVQAAFGPKVVKISGLIRA